MLAESAGAQLAGFVFEYEGASGGEVGDEIVVAQVKAEKLAADGGFGLEVVDDFESIGWTGEGGERGALGGNLNGFADDQGPDHFVLFDNSCFLNDFDKWAAAAITGGKFTDRAAGDSDDGVVDPHAGKGGHAVFDGFDEEGAIFQAGSSRAARYIQNGGLNGGDFAVLFADEGDAGIGLGGRERERGGFSGKESQPAERCLLRNCPLSFAGQRLSAHFSRQPLPRGNRRSF